MTSGNLSGKPPAISNEQALADLQGIADGFLIHNRDIVQRMDDLVVRESGETLRRSRGMCRMLALPPGFKNVPPVLCRADLKNTFCLVRGEQAVSESASGRFK
ncbi:Sua5/YciO/YrdC/YwlC family protein [Escherichia coli]